MTVREVLKILHDDGWRETPSTKGSHIQLEHGIKPGKVTVPSHGGDIPKGTLNSIMKQAGLK
ncbi:MAG: type II toxin-antitoxin system HicA family toxin [Oscillospiraceae bacterium]|jgi:predicted RNA binding protein YcfA (HicA-like mRNA interferase family)|nr:type II toxin-antitoxin system HicA family toxin [Oscillospiraceae bacterium]